MGGPLYSVVGRWSDPLNNWRETGSMKNSKAPKTTLKPRPVSWCTDRIYALGNTNSCSHIKTDKCRPTVGSTVTYRLSQMKTRVSLQPFWFSSRWFYVFLLWLWVSCVSSQCCCWSKHRTIRGIFQILCEQVWGSVWPLTSGMTGLTEVTASIS